MRRSSWALGLLGALASSLSLMQGCGSDADNEFKADPVDASGGSGGSGSAQGGAGGESGAPVVDSGGEAGQVGQGGEAGQIGEGGAAGSPGPTCSDADADNDGQSECDGDCDDMDAQNFVGNQEICGDLADNNCDMTADDPATCTGIGTFVSELTGDDVTGIGTKDNPVKTIAKGLSNAQAIVQAAAGAISSIDVYVAEGLYAENVTLVEGVNLLGGFSCTAQPCSWRRDPSMSASVVQNQRFQGVIADHTITRATRFDGFEVTGMDGNSTGNVPGSVALTLSGATPTITNNQITAGDTNGGGSSDGRSIAIAILAPSNDTRGALIDSNVITAGQSTTAVSIGILMDTTNASPGKTYAVVTRNTIVAGTGLSAYGVLDWNSGTGTVFRNNDMFGGVATDGANGVSFGFTAGGIVLLDANRINVNPTTPPSCTADAQWCGGVRSISSTATIVNNVIFGAQSELSAGVLLQEIETPAGSVSLNSNYIDGGGVAGVGTSAAVSMFIGGCCGTQTWVGRIMNNILLGGQAAARFGVYEQTTSGRQAHPEALQNNDFFIATPGAPDALYRFYNGSAQTLHKTIAAVNGLATVIGPVGANIDSDCMPTASFQLPSGSPCIDKGTATDAPASDFEGEARPKGIGFDIGPDEAE